MVERHGFVLQESRQARSSFLCNHADCEVERVLVVLIEEVEFVGGEDDGAVGGDLRETCTESTDNDVIFTWWLVVE